MATKAELEARLAELEARLAATPVSTPIPAAEPMPGESLLASGVCTHGKQSSVFLVGICGQNGVVHKIHAENGTQPCGFKVTRRVGCYICGKWAAKTGTYATVEGKPRRKSRRRK